MKVPATRAQGWLAFSIGCGLIGLDIGCLSLGLWPDYASFGMAPVGVLFLILGGYTLWTADDEFYKKNPQFENADAARQPDVRKPIALGRGAIRVTETCEACRKPYVYFPELTAISMIFYERKGFAAAPCPRCGWVQSHMIQVAQDCFPNRKWPRLIGVVGILGIGVAFVFLAPLFGRYYQEVQLGIPPAPDPDLEISCWLGAGLSSFASVVCIVLWAFLHRMDDPNRAPRDLRLQRGKLLGMPLEEYESLVNTEEWVKTESEASSAGITEKPAQPSSDKPETGIQESS